MTDNAANVAKMRTELKSTHPEMISYGCSAHILNLLSQDLRITYLKHHIVQIVKYFRNNHFAAAKYKEANCIKLVLPQDVK